MRELVLDFWREFACDIFVEADGKTVGSCRLEEPAKTENRQAAAGEASGAGAFEAHQSWLTARREIGFAEVCIPVHGVPVGREFTLTIRWQGKGKCCTYYFR